MFYVDDTDHDKKKTSCSTRPKYLSARQTSAHRNLPLSTVRSEPNSKRPILVTGSHRSGTTWVGKMISASSQIGYIHEPFNLEDAPGSGVLNQKFDLWFPYITDKNEGKLAQKYSKTLQFEFGYLAGLRSIKSAEDFNKARIWAQRYSRYRKNNVRPLVKDPIAVFSAEWLAARFDMEVIVLIRHPAAFVSSLKKLGWNFPFNHFLQQQMLMRDYLHPFEQEIISFSNETRCIVDQAILLWKLIHHVILAYRKKYPSWMFCRHEDLSTDPIRGFSSIFEKLDIEFGDDVKNVIREHTNANNPTEAAADCLRRNSKENIWNWKQRLTKDEIGHIRNQVADIGEAFYADHEWGQTA